eukprot:scaffold782_cov239-Pinguiococcus_pyrenoidosus.AAC.1
MRRIKTRSPKLAPRAIGPYEIVRELEGDTYELKHLGNYALVRCHRSQLTDLSSYVGHPEYQEIARPHLELKTNQLALRRHELIFWRYKTTRPSAIPLPLFVGEIMQMQPGRLLLHNYLDVRASSVLNFALPMIERKVAPGYSRIVTGQRQLLGTWRPRTTDEPLYEFIAFNTIDIVGRLSPEGLSPDGWTEQSWPTLRAL